MILVKEKINYIDVTDEWICNATPFSHEVKDQNYFEHNCIKYYVDGKNVVLDYSKKEKEVALWLEETFGGEIYMLPRINKPDGIKTADYLWNGEYWDLKEIKGNSRHTIDSAIKKSKKQTYNLILDISNSELSYTNAIKQLKLSLNSKDRTWVKSIILIKNNKLLIIFSKKRN